MRDSIITLVIITIILIGATGLLTGNAYAEPSRDRLWQAICQVESGGDEGAHNPGEDARGIAQIREIMVRDVNRILGKRTYSHNDAYDPKLAREMFDIYCAHYWPGGTAEELARAWNGGPRGPSKDATRGYWRKVQEHLK